MPNPKSQRLHIHARHLARLEKHLARLERENQRLSWWRLGAFVAGGIATLAAFQVSSGVGWVVGLLALIGFGVLVGLHRRLDRARRDFEITRMMTARQIARRQLDWEGMPRVETHPDDAHSLARDLTLTGERSLLQLLNTAFSRGGTNRLRGWLLRPDAASRAIQERQALLQEMMPLTGFRTRLGRESARVRSSDRPLDGHPWDEERLVQWLESHRGGSSLRPVLFFLFPFAWINVTWFVLSLAGLLPPYWIGGVAVYLLVYLGWQGTLKDLFADAAYLRDALAEFAAVSQFLENYPHPRGLAGVCAPFLGPDERRSFGEGGGVQRDRNRNAVRDERPSRLLRGVIGVASAASLQRNPFLALPLNLLMPWDLFFTYRLEGMKARLRMLLPEWLDAWYELEALNSLANFAYLNPSATFPVVEAEGPVLEAEGVGHPLIPDGTRVTNDFSLVELGEVAVITGSNMSGKSTFLRTLGVNLVLAYAGGPVLARRLRVRPMRVGTSIQVSDSLVDGLSYFYAEVKRLKGLLDDLREDDIPLFFLIDELFRGTNNEERRKGSEAYVRALAGAHGVGLVSTHDLELTHLAQSIPGVSNFHFREEITDGRMVFDYRLHPGPCPTTNALKIMALEGLPVGGEDV